MAASAVIHLLTAPPQATWGEPTGTIGGELLRVGFVADRPILSATIRLADNRTLTMTVAEEGVEVLLPPDTPGGAATITLTADLGLTTTHAVLLTSGATVTVPPPTAPAGTIRDGSAPGRQRRTLRSSSTVTAASVTRLRSRASARQVAIAVTGHLVTVRMHPATRVSGSRALASSSSWALSSSATASSRLQSRASAAVSSTASRSWRDSDEVAALIALDLL